MQVQAAVLTAQNIHLRRELASGWAAADSNMIQVRASVAACLSAFWYAAAIIICQQTASAYHAKAALQRRAQLSTACDLLVLALCVSCRFSS
jgi:hypothetical protein